MMYLEVEFGDNDFGQAMTIALKRLWKWIHKNNAHLVDSLTPRTILEMFVELEKCGALQTMVLRLFILEICCSTVEFATRGLGWEKMKWEEHKIELPHKFEQYAHYFSPLKLKLHSTKKFTTKWKNGEHAWLNLNTGESDNF